MNSCGHFLFQIGVTKIWCPFQFIPFSSCCITYGLLYVTFFLKVAGIILGAWLGTYRCSKKGPCVHLQSCLTLCDPMDCILPRLLCPWNSPGKNTGVGFHFLFHGLFPIQGSNSCLLHWEADSLPLCHLGKPAHRRLL